MIDTNQVQQVIDTASTVHTQLSPYLPALAIAAGWLGREIRNLNAWLLAASEYIIAHGGLLTIARKLLWNPAATNFYKPKGDGGNATVASAAEPTAIPAETNQPKS